MSGRHAVTRTGSRGPPPPRPAARAAPPLAAPLAPRLAVDPGADRVDEVELARAALLREQVDRRAPPGERRGEPRVVHVRARAAQEVAVEDQDPHAAMRESSCRSDRYSARMALQHYRFRTPSTGREVILPADPHRVYRDRHPGEELEPVGIVLPMAPSTSRLPWAVENLRFCDWCDQLAQRDLNDCPTCGRRMAPLAS